MATLARDGSANRFRDEAQAIQDGADWRILVLLSAASIAVTALFAGAILLRKPTSNFLWPILLGLSMSLAALGWSLTTRRILTGIGVQATAMVIGIAGVVLVQRGANAPALVYGLTTVAVVFVAGLSRLGTLLGTTLTLWTAAVTWASQNNWLGPAAPNPLGVENARMLALVVALVLIGLAARIEQRRRQGLDTLLERSLALTEAERNEAKDLAARRAHAVVEIGHEIRTPMTGIVGVAQLLSQQPLTPVQRQLLSIQRQSAERLLQLVNAVLDQAKIDAAPAEPLMAPFSPRRVAAEVTELFAPRAHRKGVEIVWVADPGLPASVQGDSMRVRQILSNLVSNAVKFTDHGAVVVHLLYPGPGQLRVEVRDSGRGIAAQRLEACFERYVSDADGEDRSHSTGLGLPISRELAHAMGGELSARSELGAGSCFVLDLPASAALPEPDVAPQPPVAIDGCLWVVGASAPLELQLRHLLAEFGLDTHFVDHPPSTAQWAQAMGQPQALMIDGWTGHGRCVEALPEILARARLQDQRVIVVSSVAQDAAFGALEDVWQVFRPASREALREALAWALEAGSPDDLPLPKAPGWPRILLVDDDAVNQIVGRAMLEELGAEVQVMQSGQEALDELLKRPFDLVLMDLQMPDMDGLEATRRWREHERARGGPRTPVVAATGQAAHDLSAMCRRAGIDAVLRKPYTIDHLRQVIAAQALRAKV